MIDVAVIHPTPPDRLVDGRGRPYFLWDQELTLEGFRERLAHGDRPTRAYLVGKMMRQARPDDVFTFVTVAEIVDLWSELVRYLGRERSFWIWLLGRWGFDVGPAD